MIADIDNIAAPWLVLGFIGQVVFGLRFVVQWIATERQRKSVVPPAFWYLSLLGSVILLTYVIRRKDPVLIAGFSLNLIIYLRNLYYVRRKGAGPAEAIPPAGGEPASPGPRAD